MALELAGTEMGAGPPVVIMHGLFGSGTNWRSIGQRLAERHRVVLLDLRNHGSSPWSDTMMYPEMAADVQAAINKRALGKVALVGHSMGGKVAMTLAVASPATVERLIVVDVAPVPYPPTLLPYIQAMRSIDAAQLRRRGEADELLRPHVPDAAIRGFLLQNVVPDEGGGFRWRLNLAAIERTMPDIGTWSAVGSYRGPTLFIAGERSDYIRSEHWPGIVALFPTARLVSIPEAGHWLHAERPQQFLDVLGPFLDGSTARSGA